MAVGTRWAAGQSVSQTAADLLGFSPHPTQPSRVDREWSRN